MATQQNVRRQEIMGKDEILGSFVGRALDAKLNPIKNGSQFVLGNDDLTEIITSGAFVGEEEKMLAREGGSAEKAALRRRTAASCGFNGKWAHIRGEEATPSDLETIKKLADGGNKKAKRLLSKLAKFAAKSKVSGDDYTTRATLKGSKPARSSILPSPARRSVATLSRRPSGSTPARRRPSKSARSWAARCWPCSTRNRSSSLPKRTHYHGLRSSIRQNSSQLGAR